MRGAGGIGHYGEYVTTRAASNDITKLIVQLLPDDQPVAMWETCDRGSLFARLDHHNPCGHKRPPTERAWYPVKMPDSDQTPLQVGSTAADFELPDTDNHLRRLSELAGDNAVAVVFYRGHW